MKQTLKNCILERGGSKFDKLSVSIMIPSSQTGAAASTALSPFCEHVIFAFPLSLWCALHVTVYAAPMLISESAGVTTPLVIVGFEQTSTVIKSVTNLLHKFYVI